MINLFEKDSRFILSFHNIGNWGENDSNIIEDSISIKLQKRALDLGANVVPIIWSLMPGSTCYASKSNSFTIGSDGKIYKCTVALYEDINDIGTLREDGSMEINQSKHQKWISSKLDDKCHDCSLLSSCLNSQCPLNRITKKETCLVSKVKIMEAVKLLSYQNLITYTLK
ncbi:hypothetical protein CBF28_12175 [Vagococcus carniphilus]|uniref:4Fe4S-binding SPASM domain-containing protein n=2 Tax=Vagococcus carniphilus TaxID=218144 RepID=A0A430ATF5_9ENTE|nr:hypothetical protein CBF28_12175 [Vagococcus carniphilus]